MSVKYGATKFSDRFVLSSKINGVNPLYSSNVKYPFVPICNNSNNYLLCMRIIHTYVDSGFKL